MGSAYWYHLHESDTQFVPGTGPKILGATGTLAGLEIEARAELQSTLRDMREVGGAAQGDERILTIGLEDFQDDFNRTTSRIYSFLLGPKRDADVAALVDAAAIYDQRQMDAGMPRMHNQ